MFTRINSGGIWAVEGVLVSVEADVSDGLPGFSISGQLASEVRESQERVRTALKNSGFRLPAKKITVNLSPAGIRKGGTAYDLPIAVAILGAFQMVGTDVLEGQHGNWRAGTGRQGETCKRCAFPGSHGQGERYQEMFPAIGKCGGGPGDGGGRHGGGEISGPYGRYS